jgi:hypothetical protein
MVETAKEMVKKEDPIVSWKVKVQFSEQAPDGSASADFHFSSTKESEKTQKDSGNTIIGVDYKNK